MSSLLLYIVAVKLPHIRVLLPLILSGSTVICYHSLVLRANFYVSMGFLF